MAATSFLSQKRKTPLSKHSASKVTLTARSLISPERGSLTSAPPQRLAHASKCSRLYDEYCSLQRDAGSDQKPEEEEKRRTPAPSRQSPQGFVAPLPSRRPTRKRAGTPARLGLAPPVARALLIQITGKNI